MTFIYLSSMVKKEGDKRCAVAAHVIPTEIDGFLRIDGYASGDSSINKLKTLNKTLHMLPRKDDRIRVVTDDHKMAWDMEKILNHQTAEFLPMNLWQGFIFAVADNGMSFRQFNVMEKGLLTAAERDLARQQICAKTKWGFEL